MIVYDEYTHDFVKGRDSDVSSSRRVSDGGDVDNRVEILQRNAAREMENTISPNIANFIDAESFSGTNSADQD